MELDFKCPKCRGDYFGSSGDTIFCHDAYEEGCKWSGPRDSGCFIPPREELEKEVERLKTELAQMTAERDQYKSEAEEIETKGVPGRNTNELQTDHRKPANDPHLQNL